MSSPVAASPAASFTIFVLLRALPAWLSLSRSRRNEIASAAMAHAFTDAAVTLRHFDAEAFTAVCSDVSVFETSDLAAFYFTMERLRDTPLFAAPYFELVHIIPAIEDGFRRFELAA
ncbi:darcynin family protein [Xanthobacter sp.]|uniref:darcynin family protein n=1 Tax=Xanthobacter sp. TaxID=35809 RepID=UPI0025F4111B|nr:darcynin family protein [Xanthobacter sp.]